MNNLGLKLITFFFCFFLLYNYLIITKIINNISLMINTIIIYDNNMYNELTNNEFTRNMCSYTIKLKHLKRLKFT